MKNVLFIASHRPGRAPSQRFRFEQYLGYLAENGIESHFSYLLSEADDKLFYRPGNVVEKLRILRKCYRRRMEDLRTLGRYDAVFISREALMTRSTRFERAFREGGKKIIYDFDDAIWLPNVSNANRLFAFAKNPAKTAAIIGLADTVVAGNRYLADYASRFNQNVAVIPTTIDTNTYQREPLPERDHVTIGWSGSVTTIQHFSHAIPILKRVREKYGDRVRIEVIGDAQYKNEALGVQGMAWRAETEVRDLSGFDIGIMPLPDDEWAKGKCGLKGLQYMALEVPTIMSPVGVNSEIIRDGENGFLATTETEWFERICRLIEDRPLRGRLGKAGRKTVEDRYSVEANKAKYLDLFRF